MDDDEHQNSNTYDDRPNSIISYIQGTLILRIGPKLYTKVPPGISFETMFKFIGSRLLSKSSKLNSNKNE